MWNRRHSDNWRKYVYMMFFLDRELLSTFPPQSSADSSFSARLKQWKLIKVHLPCRCSASGVKCLKIILIFNSILLIPYSATSFHFSITLLFYLVDIETEQGGPGLLIPGHLVTGRTETRAQVHTALLRHTMTDTFYFKVT